MDRERVRWCCEHGIWLAAVPAIGLLLAALGRNRPLALAFLFLTMGVVAAWWVRWQTTDETGATRPQWVGAPRWAQVVFGCSYLLLLTGAITLVSPRHNHGHDYVVGSVEFVLGVALIEVVRRAIRH